MTCSVASVGFPCLLSPDFGGKGANWLHFGGKCANWSDLAGTYSVVAVLGFFA